VNIFDACLIVAVASSITQPVPCDDGRADRYYVAQLTGQGVTPCNRIARFKCLRRTSGLAQA